MPNLIGTVLLAVVMIGVFVVHRLIEMGTLSKTENYNTETCNIIANLSGSEDLQVDYAEDLLYISKNDWEGYFKEQKGQGGAIYVLDLKQKDAKPKLVSVDQPADFKPHGFNLYVDPKTGEKTLFVVNHKDNHQNVIEIFDVIDRDTIKHRETFAHPLLTNPNDVVGTGKRSFYVTQDVKYPHGSYKVIVATLFGVEGSTVDYYDGTNFKQVAEGLNFANGIVSSADGKLIYVAESTGRKLKVFERNMESGNLTLKASHDLHCGADNINIDEQGNLWIAGFPNVLAMSAHLRDKTKQSPVHLLKVNIEGGEVSKITKVFSSAGDFASGITVTTVYKDKIFFSGVLYPDIMMCNIPQNPLPIQPTNTIDL